MPQFRVKKLDSLLADAEHSQGRLKRALGPFQLTALGVGAIISAGIFSTVGSAAAGASEHEGAGPALIISFILVAGACALAAFCYAEFASMVPISGSAYTYAYATLGEIAAWLIGWDLILEYAVGNVAVAISWSAYFQDLLRGFHIAWPGWLGMDYRSAAQAAHEFLQAQAAHKDLSALDPAIRHAAEIYALAPRVLGLPIIMDLPAALVVVGITWVLVIGVRESARFNTTMVVLKLAIIVFFLVLGSFYIKPANWLPFAPNGFKGISSAAAIIFFAYIGFDAVSTASEEARNPQRDIPFAIMASLVICTIVYIAVAIVLTGLTHWTKLATAEPLAFAFTELGMGWAAAIVSAGALLANGSVLLAFQMGQPRIFFSMARDGLLPAWAKRVHPRYQTPHVTTILTGVLVAVFAGVTNINEVVELTNIGTLFAFILVAVGVLILRWKEPGRVRPFRTPWVPWVPLGAVFTCGYLMCQLPRVTWERFVIWMAVGLVIYFGYGLRNSRLGRAHSTPVPVAPDTADRVSP